MQLPLLLRKPRLNSIAAVRIRWCDRGVAEVASRRRGGRCACDAETRERKADDAGVVDASRGSGDEDDALCYGVGMDVQCESDPSPVPTNAGSALVGAGGLLGLLSLTSPFFFWGTAMVAMKAEAEHTTPLFLGAMRLIPAGGVLLAWNALKRRELLPRNAYGWFKVCVFALLDGTCFQGFLAEGIQKTGAGLGSIIIDSQPISVAILASLFLGEKASLKTAAGLLVGVLGLGLLELPQEFVPGLAPSLASVGSDPALAVTGGSLWENGEFLMLLAAQSMALGTVIVRWVCKDVDPVAATAWHMMIGGIPLLIASMLGEPDLPARLATLAPPDLLLLAYITLFGGAASYGLFFLNANRGNLTKLSSLTFLTPVFACVFGSLLLGESFSDMQLAGASVTLIGILIVTVDFQGLIGSEGVQPKEE